MAGATKRIAQSRFGANQNIRARSHVSWDKDGQLDARGILTYSQSEESDSPHYSDQTELYSRGEWLKFPFADAEIAADPNLISLRLTE